MGTEEPLEHPANRRYAEAKGQAVRLVSQLRKQLKLTGSRVGQVARQPGYGAEPVRPASTSGVTATRSPLACKGLPRRFATVSGRMPWRCTAAP